MTPKEKAKELVVNYIDNTTYCLNNKIAKKCALIAVDLHLTELHKMKLMFSDRELHYKYWEEVKQEIQAL